MSFRSVAVKHGSRMRGAKDIARTLHVLASVRILTVLLTATRGDPLRRSAQTLSGAFASALGRVGIEISLRGHLRSRYRHRFDALLELPIGEFWELHFPSSRDARARTLALP